MLISIKCICGKEYSVTTKDFRTPKANVKAMVKGELELSKILEDCDCDIKKPIGFKDNLVSV